MNERRTAVLITHVPDPNEGRHSKVSMIRAREVQINSLNSTAHTHAHTLPVISYPGSGFVEVVKCYDSVAPLLSIALILIDDSDFHV